MSDRLTRPLIERAMQGDADAAGSSSSDQL
jgi:hypothetical protein